MKFSKCFSSIIILIFFIFSCKTTTDPVKYDKNIESANKEAQVIQFLINNGSYEKASEKIDYILKFYPDNFDVIELKGWLLLKTNKLNESEKIFNDLLSKNNKNPHAYAGLARIYRINGNKDKALEMIKKGLEYLPTISILWFEKGLLEFDNNDYKKALIDFNKSYLFDNSYTDAYFFKYLTMLKLGRDFDEIKYYWNKIISDRSYKSWYFLYNANVLYEMNLKEYALNISENSLIYYPDDPYLLNLNAYLLFENYLKNNDEKILSEAEANINKCFEKSTNIEAGFVDTYLSILEAKNDKEKLISELNKYMLIFPESPLLIKWINKYNKK